MKLLFGAVILTATMGTSSLSQAQTAEKRAERPDIVTRATVKAGSSLLSRGDTLTDGPVIEPSVYFFHTSGLGFGVWTYMPMLDSDGENSFVPDQDKREPGRIDFRFLYSVPTPKLISARLMYLQYYYPQGNALNIDVLEDAIGIVSLNTPLHPTISASYGLSEPIKRDSYVEASVDQDVFKAGRQKVNVKALAAYRQYDDDTKTDGWSHWGMEARYQMGPVGVEARHLEQIDEDVRKLSSTTKTSGAVSYTHTF